MNHLNYNNDFQSIKIIEKNNVINIYYKTINIYRIIEYFKKLKKN